MTVLDELREAMQGDIDATPHTSSDYVENIWYAEGAKDAMRRLDAFEAAHPGLIDKTLLCKNCGEPMPRYYSDGSGGPGINSGWSYICTQVGEKYDEFYLGEDEEIWLVCPACAQEATGDA